jgi:hypothetical protein
MTRSLKSISPTASTAAMPSGGGAHYVAILTALAGHPGRQDARELLTRASAPRVAVGTDGQRPAPGPAQTMRRNQRSRVLASERTPT